MILTIEEEKCLKEQVIDIEFIFNILYLRMCIYKMIILCLYKKKNIEILCFFICEHICSMVKLFQRLEHFRKIKDL